MPKTMEQLEQDFKSFQEESKKKVDALEKTFEARLKAAEDKAQASDTAAVNAEKALLEFKEKAKKESEEAAKKLAEARREDIKAFVEKAVKEGRLLPAAKEFAIQLLGSMTSDVTVATFEEKDGSKKQHTQYSLMRALIEILPAHKGFTEHTVTGKKKVENPGAQTEKTFTTIKKSGENMEVEVDEQDLHEKAVAYQDEQRAQNKSVSYDEALIYVSRKEKTESASA